MEQQKKSKEQIIEDLRNFIGRDISDDVYDIVATAAEMQPGTALIDIAAYRSAAKITDNKNIALWIASQQRRKEDVLIVNRDSEGNSVLDSGHDWMSIREIADYFMEDVEYMQKVLEQSQFDLSSKSLEPVLIGLKAKREFYLSLSEKVGELELMTGKETIRTALAELCAAWHVPFMELYPRYEISGNVNDAIADYSNTLQKKGQLTAFSDAVEVEDIFLQKEMELYHVLVFRAVMKMKTLNKCVIDGRPFQFKKEEDFYLLFLNELGENRRMKEYLSGEDKEFLKMLEEEVKAGNPILPEQLSQLIPILQNKQLTKKENTRLYCYLAEKEGIWQ